MHACVLVRRLGGLAQKRASDTYVCSLSGTKCSSYQPRQQKSLKLVTPLMPSFLMRTRLRSLHLFHSVSSHKNVSSHAITTVALTAAEGRRNTQHAVLFKFHFGDPSPQQRRHYTRISTPTIKSINETTQSSSRCCSFQPNTISDDLKWRTHGVDIQAAHHLEHLLAFAFGGLDTSTLTT